MIQRQLVLVELREHGTDVQVSVGLDLGALQPRLDRQGALQEVKCRAHLADAAVVACHVIEGHSLAELVVLTQLLRLFEQVKRAVDVLLLEVVDGQDVANLAQLLACSRELLRRCSKMYLLDLEELLEDADRLDILALFFGNTQRSQLRESACRFSATQFQFKADALSLREEQALIAIGI